MKIFEIILLIFLFAIPAVQAANQTQIISDVQNAPYNTTEYIINVFDCSNMAMLQHDWLVKRGHTVYIWCGCNKTYKIGHAWLQVDGYMVEPTSKDWAWWYYENNGNLSWCTWDMRWTHLPRWDDQQKSAWTYYPHTV